MIWRAWDSLSYWGCILILIFFAAVMIAYPPIFLGGTHNFLRTYGVSMEPLLHQGTFVVVEKENSYNVGDVVAYESNIYHRLILHRIQKVNQDGTYTLKGDNNKYADGEKVTQDQFHGRMVADLPHGATVFASHWTFSFAAIFIILSLMASYFQQDAKERP